MSDSKAPSPAQPSEADRPLEGLRVLDFSRLLPGPLATRLLAEQGAEVIKIEHPTRQDPLRGYPPFVGKRNAYDLVLNAGKRHLLADPATAAGKELLFRLIERSDVLLESFRPGVMASMGLGPETCLRRNPRLIYTSLTGYGQHGKNAALAGHDLNFQALSGILHWSRDSKGHLQHPGLPLADIAGGSYGAVQAILAALWQRERSGRGQHLDVSMARTVAPLASLALATQAASQQADLPLTAPQHGALSGGLARYALYACRDGKWVALAALEPKFWIRFCAAVGKKEWSNRLSFSIDDQEYMRTELERLFKSKDQAEWTKIGQEADCCLSPVVEPEHIGFHGQADAAKLEEASSHSEARPLAEPLAGLPILTPTGSVQHPAPSDVDAEQAASHTTGHAHAHSPTRPSLLNAAPLPGADSRAILDELGYSAKEQEALFDSKTVA